MENMLAYKSLSAAVRDKIIDLILFSGRYKPGDWLNESDIAIELEVSKAPIREALRELAAKGLVKIVPRKGSYVAAFTENEMDELYNLRFSLEMQIYKDLINKKRLEEDDLAYLVHLVDKMVDSSQEEALREVVLPKFMALDIEFHQYLWRKSGLRFTRKILTNIHYQILLGIMEDLKHAESLEETARLHYEVIKALRRADIKTLEENRAYSYFVRRKTGFADVQKKTDTGSLLPEEKPAAL
jgi:DNA-binding GntR family transcriptional regulator